LCWPAAVAFALVWLTVAIASNYAAVGTFFATVVGLVPLWMVIGVPGALGSAAFMVIVAFALREDFVRLRDGIEPMLRPEKIGRGVRAEPASVVRLSGQTVQSF